MIRFSFIWLTLLVPFFPNAGGESCRDLCEKAGEASSSAACNCCYENLELEPLTARNWMSNEIHVDEKRHEWFQKRMPFEPIVGDDTLIAGTLYTISERTLKMTIVFPPLHPNEARTANVIVTGSSSGNTKSSACTVKEHTWNCLIRFDNLSNNEAYSFQVSYQPDPTSADLVYTYDGVIPKQQGYPKIAALGCFGPDSTKDKSELVEAVISTAPDMLVLQGDQTYFSESLGYGFLELVYTINKITRMIPTIVQLDDHDYGQGNIWGAGNNPVDSSGAGFKKPPCIVNAIQDLAMGHLPDPATEETLLNGITIHYTNYIYGSADFAILEARKFKNHKSGGDSLLGHDQEAWLDDWCNSAGKRLKIVLAQTPFAATATNVTNISKGRIAGIGNAIDTNAYPVSGRNRFMKIIETCSPLILSGDQHLGIAVSYDDYGVSECASPAVINDIFWRLNLNELGESYTEAFGHQYKLLGVWNVEESIWKEYGQPWNTRQASEAIKKRRADGFLVVDLDGKTATCEMHSYRTSHDIVWKVDVPCESTLAEKRGYCFNACDAPSGKQWVCGKSLACSACDATSVCPSLCQHCPAGSIYGGLACTC